MASTFPTSLSPEALLPVLTAQLGSELLAKQVIKTLEKAAENEAKKRQLAAAAAASSSIADQTIPSITSLNLITGNGNDQRTETIPKESTTATTTKIEVQQQQQGEEQLSPAISTSSTTSSNHSQVLSTSNVLNVPLRATSHQPSTRASSIRRPSPSTSAYSNKSVSSSGTGESKPFHVNTRGRKRVYTDEERRLRKNFSSKKSREKHTETVMEKKYKLEQLQDKHRELMEKRLQLDKEIQEHRQHLCPYCLNVVEEALREIGKGQDIVVLKRVNFCCATFHAQQRTDCLSNPGTSAAMNNLLADSVIKTEPSEFSSD